MEKEADLRLQYQIFIVNCSYYYASIRLDIVGLLVLSSYIKGINNNNNMALTKRTARLVVLIDDNEIDNMIHKALLQRKQFAQNIFSFVNSVEALAAIKKLTEKVDSSTEFPDYIFLDIGMPVMDGFSFLDEYEKLDKKLLKVCKLIILTSSIAPEGKKESLKRESVAGYISKPLTEEALSALFNNRLSAS